MTDKALQDAVAAMNSGNNQFDVTIICTTDDHQASYWMELLETGLLKGQKVLAVSEDWAAGGAGNGLGTLYAWKKACLLAKSKYNMDLTQELKDNKVSAALYHTAGKGTRMAPLPASENNNKPGVKLPFPLQLADGSVRPLTVLESVVRQTGIYASSRKGRLSVFWGDQVFLPSAPFVYESTHHIDILCTLIGETAPTAQEWQEKGLDKYGVIAVMESNNNNDNTERFEAAQVEKVSHETAIAMLGALGKLKQVGPSLGSFSVSASFLDAICAEYSAELTAKTGKLDTDPHFWMPLTLPLDSYVSLMKQKGTDETESKAHYERMSAFKTQFLGNAENAHLGLFGAVNVGKEACWWDYGQLKLYSRNSLLLLEEDSDETNMSATLLRQFLGVSSHQMNCTVSDAATVDARSYLFASKIGAGATITSSILAGVQAGTIECDGAIVVNCCAKKIKAGKGSILYNLIDDSDEGIVVEDAGVVVAVTDETGADFQLKSRTDIDGGQSWKIKLDMNEYSFEDVHKKNKDANIGVIAKKRQEKYDAVAATLTF